MDNFSWGNTRVVVGEKNGKQIVAVEDEGFDPSMIPMETWESFATRNGLEGAQRFIMFDDYHGRIENVAGVHNEMQEFSYAKPRGHMNLLYSGDPSRLMSSRGLSNVTGMPSASINGDASSPFASSYVNPRFSHFSELQSTRQSIIQGGGENIQQQAAAPLDPEIEGKLIETIARVLKESDLNTTTKRQLREAVEDIMGMNFVGARIAHVDGLIDEELEKLEDEDVE
ncbi:hypothetical protein DV451_001775 [Geotrichum candidum]|nr:hypothetical protein DV451_001775 [Geotrichum candidum]KAI9212924.1 hypothetical protein DS838_002186 [Geotrichum bryndzae]KAF5110986.1 hypothetical protein DV454_004756 [Geotrichum candidum]KAF5119890.1 hypothetical protein DV452_001407 [Geotrichum candidum]KAF7499384.1 hypothetical protein DV113_002576 [Geotrichum candidum]